MQKCVAEEPDPCRPTPPPTQKKNQRSFCHMRATEILACHLLVLVCSTLLFGCSGEFRPLHVVGREREGEREREREREGERPISSVLENPPYNPKLEPPPPPASSYEKSRTSSLVQHQDDEGTEASQKGLGLRV